MIVLFAALFVWLALGMFGLFNLQVPGWLQERVSRISDRQQQGTLIGTAIMGALSSLIVTACVAPPLVASLAVIGQSGDVFRGGAALFALSLGMGAPLLVVGASAGELLPRAGAWMDTVKNLFGVLMLGVAAWMLARIVPERWALVIWAIQNSSPILGEPYRRVLHDGTGSVLHHCLMGSMVPSLALLRNSATG